MPSAECFFSYLFAVPRAIFLTLRFKDPRGAVRLAFGVAFLRAVRLAFLRSSLLSDFVFAMDFRSEIKDELSSTVIQRPTKTVILSRAFRRRISRKTFNLKCSGAAFPR